MKRILDYEGTVGLPVDMGSFGDLDLIDMGETLGMQVYDHLPEKVWHKWRHLDGEQAVKGRLHIIVEVAEETE